MERLNYDKLSIPCSFKPDAYKRLVDSIRRLEDYPFDLSLYENDIIE